MPINKKLIERWSGALGVVAAVIAGVYGVVAFVDSRIERRITDDDTLSKIASLVRPSCIFDERGSILYDSGAMQYIESLTLEGAKTEKEKLENALPLKITLRPKKFLKDAPILSAVDAYTLTVKVEQGEKFDWVYSLHYMGIDSFQKCRFRLELLQ